MLMTEMRGAEERGLITTGLLDYYLMSCGSYQPPPSPLLLEVLPYFIFANSGFLLYLVVYY
jgi:hypothetical protein